MNLTIVIARGAWGTVEAILLPSEVSPAVEFLQEDVRNMSVGGKKRTARAAEVQCYALFQTMANIGQVSPKRFKSEMEGFWAFRLEIGNLQIRFPCFRDGNRWILTHGFFKPGARNAKLGSWPSEEVNRAMRIRDDYFQRKRQLEEEQDRRNR